MQLDSMALMLTRYLRVWFRLKCKEFLTPCCSVATCMPSGLSGSYSKASVVLDSSFRGFSCHLNYLPKDCKTVCVFLQ